MPVISMFYGVFVLMYSFDDARHHKPHIHVRYQNFHASFSIEDCVCLSGKLPPGKVRMVQAWIEIHREELLANWELALQGEPLFRITPLS